MVTEMMKVIKVKVARLYAWRRLAVWGAGGVLAHADGAAAGCSLLVRQRYRKHVVLPGGWGVRHRRAVS